MIEKILERLEKQEEASTDIQYKYGIRQAINIVQEVAQEYSHRNSDLVIDSSYSNDLMVVEALPSLYPLQSFEEEAIHRVVASAKSDGWIPCSERLPEEKENPITKDYYVYPVMVDLGKRSDIRYYGFGNGHWWHGLTKMDGLVTHWMDIKPYQPKGE